jgi:hypothetical protein
MTRRCEMYLINGEHLYHMPTSWRKTYTLEGNMLVWMCAGTSRERVSVYKKVNVRKQKSINPDITYVWDNHVWECYSTENIAPKRLWR